MSLTEPPPGAPLIVHPGAICAIPGAHGETAAGTEMFCRVPPAGKTKHPRWGAVHPRQKKGRRPRIHRGAGLERRAVARWLATDPAPAAALPAELATQLNLNQLDALRRAGGLDPNGTRTPRTTDRDKLDQAGLVQNGQITTRGVQLLRDLEQLDAGNCTPEQVAAFERRIVDTPPPPPVPRTTDRPVTNRGVVDLDVDEPDTPMAGYEQYDRCDLCKGKPRRACRDLKRSRDGVLVYNTYPHKRRPLLPAEEATMEFPPEARADIAQMLSDRRKPTFGNRCVTCGHTTDNIAAFTCPNGCGWMPTNYQGTRCTSCGKTTAGDSRTYCPFCNAGDEHLIPANVNPADEELAPGSMTPAQLAQVTTSPAERVLYDPVHASHADIHAALTDPDLDAEGRRQVRVTALNRGIDPATGEATPTARRVQYQEALRLRTSGAYKDLIAARDAADLFSVTRAELDQQVAARALTDSELARALGTARTQLDQDRYAAEADRRKTLFRAAAAAYDWTPYGPCTTDGCDAPAGEPCRDLRSPGSYNRTPHPGRARVKRNPHDVIMSLNFDRTVQPEETPPAAHLDRLDERTLRNMAASAPGSPLSTAAQEALDRRASLTGGQQKQSDSPAEQATRKLKALQDQLDQGGAVTRDDARTALNGLTADQLGQVAANLGMSRPTGSKNELAERIVGAAVGRKLISKGIHAGVQDGPTLAERIQAIPDLNNGPKPIIYVDPEDDGFRATGDRAADKYAALRAGTRKVAIVNPEFARVAFDRASTTPAAQISDDDLEAALHHVPHVADNHLGRDKILSEAARRMYPPNPSAQVVSGRRSNKPVMGNTWSSPQPEEGKWHFHDDGVVGQAMHQLGDDRLMDVDGEPVVNHAGMIATDVDLCRITPQEGVERMARLRDRTPPGSQAHAALDRAVAEMACPDLPAPVVDERAPEPVRRLIADLHTVPMVRRTGQETSRLVGVVDQWVAGDRRYTGMSFIDRVREAAYNVTHESNGDRGKRWIDRRVLQAVEELQELRRTNRAALYPPTEQR